LTVPANPSIEESWIVAVAVPPADGIDNAVELVETETACPPPLKATVCGEPPALSVIVKVPARVPAAVGVKVTEIMQPDPAPTLVPQLFVWAKSPDATIDAMVRLAVPEFVIVIVCAALVVPSVCGEKVRLVSERVTVGAVTTGAIPVPVSATVCGEPLALSAIVSNPARVPTTVGANVTEIEQFAPPANELPHVEFSAKSPAAVMEVMESVALPELVSVTVCAGLELLKVMLPKLRAELDKTTAGTAGLMLKVSADDVPPPGAGVVTVTCAVPEVTTSDAGTAAVS